MAKREINNTDGHYLSGAEVTVDTEINFTTTSSPEIDSQGGSFQHKIISSNGSAWKLRDDVKGTDVLKVDTLNDVINKNLPIQGEGTSNQLNLNDGGTWAITNDAGVYGSSYVYGDANYAYLAVGTKSELIAGTDGIVMQTDGTGMTGDPVAYITPSKIGIVDDLGGVPFNIGIQVQDNTSAVNSVTSQTSIVFVNAYTSSSNAGVQKSVLLGGINMTAKTDNTAYANQISLQPPLNTFDGLLVPSAITADRTWTFPDRSGEVELVKKPYSSTAITAAIALTDHVVEATAAGITLTLPPISGTTGKEFVVKNTSGSNITLAGDGAELIDLQNTQTIQTYDSITVISNGTKWLII